MKGLTDLYRIRKGLEKTVSSWVTDHWSPRKPFAATTRTLAISKSHREKTFHRFFGMACLAALFGATNLSATSHCYLQRSHCFAVDDGKAKIVMYVKRGKFIAAAKKHGIPKREINDIIKRAEGKSDTPPPRNDLRDSRGYYGGVYWNQPIYPYPYHHHGHHDHDHDHDGHKPDRPNRPDRPIQRPDRPIQRPDRPIQRPNRPIQRPNRPIQRPVNRPIQRPRPRPRPRPIRRPMRRR